MKNEPNIGDYVKCKKPFAGRYPIGVVEKNEGPIFGSCSMFDGVSNVYIVQIPTDDPKVSRCDTIPVWRQADQLFKSTHKKYINQAMLRMLEL